MTGSWHGGKGSDPRPEAEPGAFARGFDAIDWEARAREASCPLCGCIGIHACVGHPMTPWTEQDKADVAAAMQRIVEREADHGAP